MRRIRVVSTAAVITMVAIAIASCSSSSGPKGPTVSLAGTYSMLSITMPPNPTVTPPIATGTLTLGDSTYNVLILIATSQTSVDTVADNGTYSVSGGTWTQTSNVVGAQGVGTYTLKGDTLSVDVTTAGQQVSNVWLKQ